MTWKGTFIKNEPDGYCTAIYADGDTIIGESKEGFWDGKITVYSQNGLIYNETWSNRARQTDEIVTESEEAFFSHSI